MKRQLVPMFLRLLLLAVFLPVTARGVLVQVTSYKKSRTTQNGPVRCALDTANKTISSSSLEDCSLNCTRDDSCTGFNIKNATTCDMYNYKPKITFLDAGCVFYQV